MPFFYLLNMVIPLLVVFVIGFVVYFLVRSGGTRGLGKGGKVGGFDMRGKTQEQKAIMKYFIATGCLASLFKISEQEFDTILTRKVSGYNVFEMALSKIGIDRDEVREINPVFFDNYHLGSAYSKLGKDFVYRSSEYQLSCLLFSATQVYLYSFVFDLTSVATSEHTEEYFYEDIVSVSTDTNVLEVTVPNGCLGFDVDRREVKRLSLRIVVPGDAFSCAMRSENEMTIQGMKAKLREKKH